MRYLLLTVVKAYFETYRYSCWKVTGDTDKDKQWFHEHHFIAAAQTPCSSDLVSVHIYCCRRNVGWPWCAWRWLSRSQSLVLWSNIRTVKWNVRFKKWNYRDRQDKNLMMKLAVATKFNVEGRHMKSRLSKSVTSVAGYETTPCFRLKVQAYGTEVWKWISFCDRARVLIYILQNQLFALKYTLKTLLIKIN